MKLSWLNTSKGSNQTKHVYDMNNMNNAQCKRERVRESGSNANTKICFEVRAPNSTSPPSHRRIFTIASTQDFPHREPPLRIWVIQTGSTQLLSQPIQPLHLEARHNNYHLYTQRDGHLTKQQSTYHQRDTNHNFHNHLSLEGYQHNHPSVERYHKE